jgi:hypothetical protein
MKRLIILATALIVLAIPAMASAHRPAVKAEKQAILFYAISWSDGTPVAEPRSTPLKCFVVTISTVVKGSAWGGWTFSRYAFGDGNGDAKSQARERQCHTANGWGVLHRESGTWYDYWEGDEGYPPTHETDYSGAVPRAIAKDILNGLDSQGHF